MRNAKMSDWVRWETGGRFTYDDYLSRMQSARGAMVAEEFWGGACELAGAVQKESVAIWVWVPWTHRGHIGGGHAPEQKLPRPAEETEGAQSMTPKRKREKEARESTERGDRAKKHQRRRPASPPPQRPQPPKPRRMPSALEVARKAARDKRKESDGKKAAGARAGKPKKQGSKRKRAHDDRGGKRARR